MPTAISITSENPDLTDIISQHQSFTEEKGSKIAVNDSKSTTIISLNDWQKKLEKPYYIGDLFNALHEAALKLDSTLEEITINDYTLNHSKKTLFNNKTSIDLTEKEAEIIKFLIGASPEAVSRNELLQKIWGYNSKMDTHTLETHIYRLRKKIKNGDEFIITEKEGYKIT